MKKQFVKSCTLFLSAVLFASSLPLSAPAFGAARRPGDVDGDGTLAAGDARLALRAAVGLEQFAGGSPEFLAADADGSGVIEASDARLILRASVGLEPLGGEEAEEPQGDTFLVGDFVFHYGRYEGEDEKSDFLLNKDGSLRFESDHNGSYTGKWEVILSEYDGWALLFTTAAGSERLYWAVGDDAFDTAFQATGTYRYVPGEQGIKDYQRFLFEQPGSLSVDPAKEKSGGERGRYYPTDRYGDIISDGDYIYAVSELRSGETPAQSLFRASCSGGRPEKMGDWQITDMMCHNGWIYAVVNTDGMNSILRISSDGTTSETLMPAFEKTEYYLLDVTDSSVYFERRATVRKGFINDQRTVFSRYYRISPEGGSPEMLPLDYAVFDSMKPYFEGTLSVKLADGYLYYVQPDTLDLCRVRIDGKNGQSFYSDSYSAWSVYHDAVYILIRDRSAGESRVLKISADGNAETIVTVNKITTTLNGYYNGVVFGCDPETGALAPEQLPKSYWTEGAYEAEGWLRQSNVPIAGTDLLIDIRNKKGYYISAGEGVTNFDHNYQFQ